MYKAKLIAVDRADQLHDVTAEGVTSTQAHERLMNKASVKLKEPDHYKALIVCIVEGDGQFTVTAEHKEVPDAYQN